jgi:hypothetical protein
MGVSSGGFVQVLAADLAEQGQQVVWYSDSMKPLILSGSGQSHLNRTDTGLMVRCSSVRNRTEKTSSKHFNTDFTEKKIQPQIHLARPTAATKQVRRSRPFRDRESKHLRLEPRHRKYHYQIHPVFRFMHARIQTWFPFAVQICLNGREWLARSMDAKRIGHVRRDNCFTWLNNPAQAQRLMDQQLQAAWPDLLNAIARELNPAHEAMFQAFPIEYYWSTYQSEWATDILFRDAGSLARLYPRLVSRGEFAINGFRNRDLRALLYADQHASKPEQRRHAAAVTRQLALLRAHGLIRKVAGTHRYHLSSQGRVIVTALITIRNAKTDAITKLAA